MYASTILLAVPVIIGRFFVVQSPLWLAYRGRVEEAEVATARLLRRDPPYPKEVVLRAPVGAAIAHAQAQEHAPWSALFAGVHLRRTILASVPWFLQDLGTYGIGIFTPTILATVIGASIEHPRNTAELIQSDILATRGAALIDVLLIVGIVCAVLLADRVGRIRLQIMGFIGCAVGLLLAALSLHVGGALAGVLLFAGFMLFSFMTNIGPNAMTYLIAGEIFPIAIRGTGAGFAASFGGCASLRVVDEHMTHRLRSGGEEVSAVGETGGVLPRHLDVRLVDERRRVQRVIALPTATVGPGKPFQLGVDRVEQAIGRCRLARPRFLQQRGDRVVAHWSLSRVTRHRCAR